MNRQKIKDFVGCWERVGKFAHSRNMKEVETRSKEAKDRGTGPKILYREGKEKTGRKNMKKVGQYGI